MMQRDTAPLGSKFPTLFIYKKTNWAPQLEQGILLTEYEIESLHFSREKMAAIMAHGQNIWKQSKPHSN